MTRCAWCISRFNDGGGKPTVSTRAVWHNEPGPSGGDLRSLSLRRLLVGACFTGGWQMEPGGHRVRGFLFGLGALIVMAAPTMTGSPAGGAPGSGARPITREHFNAVEGPLTARADAPLSLGGVRAAAGVICSTGTSAAANVNTDCELDGNTPSNETTIAVNPSNPLDEI